MNLLILMHLMGDLSQPLHTGYDEDLGGNRRALQYDTLKTNMHKFWDEDIIRLNKITLQDCLDLYKSFGSSKADTIDGIHPVQWMKETRSLLPAVYNFEGFTVNKEYVDKSSQVVKRQLLMAGIRLADILNKLFISETPVLDMKTIAAKYKNGIEAKDALLFTGKKVTVCGRVFGIKITDKVTFINVGDKYPKSPLTIVIMAKDNKNFPQTIDEMFTDKNICIKGELVEYNGKSEIMVSNSDEIIIQ